MFTGLLPTLLIIGVLVAIPISAVHATDPPGEAVVIKRSGGWEQRGFLTRPPGWAATDRRPAVIFLHGGGWKMRNLDMFAWQAERMAELGAVTMIVDYRSMVKEKATMAQLLSDARSAVRHLRANAASYGIDPNRIIGAGGSSGGHLIACAALIDGPAFDDPADDRAIDHRPNLLMGFNPVLARDDAEVSPAAHVRAASPPLTMVYGNADANWLPTAQAYERAAKAAGATVEMHLYDGQKHGFFNSAEMRQRTLAAMLPFVYRHGMLDAQVVAETGAALDTGALLAAFPKSSWPDLPAKAPTKPGLLRLEGRQSDNSKCKALLRVAVTVDDTAAVLSPGAKRRALTDRGSVPEGQPIQHGEGVAILAADQTATFTLTPPDDGVWEVQVFTPLLWRAGEARVVIKDRKGAQEQRVPFGKQLPAWRTLGLARGGPGAPLTVIIHGQDGAEIPADAIRFMPPYTGSIP